MFGAGLHEAWLNDLGGLGQRKLAGCLHPSAGDLTGTCGSILSASSWGSQEAGSPFCRLAQRAQRGLCLEGLRWGRVFQVTWNPARHWGCHDLELGSATGSQALPVWLEGGGWILACPAPSE